MNSKKDRPTKKEKDQSEREGRPKRRKATTNEATTQPNDNQNLHPCKRQPESDLSEGESGSRKKSLEKKDLGSILLK